MTKVLLPQALGVHRFNMCPKTGKRVKFLSILFVVGIVGLMQLALHLIFLSVRFILTRSIFKKR